MQNLYRRSTARSRRHPTPLRPEAQSLQSLWAAPQCLCSEVHSRCWSVPSGLLLSEASLAARQTRLPLVLEPVKQVNEQGPLALPKKKEPRLQRVVLVLDCWTYYLLQE